MEMSEAHSCEMDVLCRSHPSTLTAQPSRSPQRSSPAVLLCSALLFLPALRAVNFGPVFRIGNVLCVFIVVGLYVFISVVRY